MRLQLATIVAAPSLLAAGLLAACDVPEGPAPAPVMTEWTERADVCPADASCMVVPITRTDPFSLDPPTVLVLRVPDGLAPSVCDLAGGSPIKVGTAHYCYGADY